MGALPDTVVIGGGWAGCAAALAAARRGERVRLLEAARTLGGRARRVEVGGLALDNGQHILIGAYTETLALLKTLGVAEHDAFTRIPMSLLYPSSAGIEGLKGGTSRSARWNVAQAVLSAGGWGWADKLSLVRVALRWELARFDCVDAQTVADVCRGLSPRVWADLIEPLCVSALNTPAARASGRVFLRIMRDALFATPGGSDFLIPRQDLSALLPERAAREIEQRGGRVIFGERAARISRVANGWSVQSASQSWLASRIVIACPAAEAARLARSIGEPAAAMWADATDALPQEAITTVYARSSAALPWPVLALRSDAAAPAQFVFDKGELAFGQRLWAFVISASQGSAQALEAATLAQGRSQLRAFSSTELQLEAIQTITEKRATFACIPGLKRPAREITDGLVACADYCDGPYPATLEQAVRHGLAT